jgi:endonuclease YncB( thermonuclease family)
MTPTNTSSPLLRLALVAAIAVAIAPNSARTQDLAGQAAVIDGDTLEIHGKRIRLWGIDAPEHDQLCRGDDSLPYRCGAAAAIKLDAFIGHRPVYCAPKDIDRYGRVVASCRADASDLGEWLVGDGFALDWSRYSKGRYSAAQREAERAGRGMWAGSYVEPWDYRACVRAGGRPAECSDDATAHP